MLQHRRTTRRSNPILWIAVVLVVLPAAQSVADGEFPEVSERMRQFVEDKVISGAVTLVGHQGKVVHLSAVGLANIDERRPMSADTMFRIMSMTKPITATALMILVDEGKLSIDDPVEKFLPAFAEAKLKDGETVQTLKIRHLLTHTSGLGGDQRRETSLAATADMLAKRPFNFQPGTKWEYGPSLNVVGRIIEVASGQPYEQFLAQRIFEPLGMTNTTFPPPASSGRELRSRISCPMTRARSFRLAGWWSTRRGRLSPIHRAGCCRPPATCSASIKWFSMVASGMATVSSPPTPCEQ